MKPTGFFNRSELGRQLWSIRREVAWVGVFSFFANVLVLAPTLYMLQLFDRVMLSGNLTTLLALTLITVFFFLVMGFAEWVRSRLLVRVSARLDEALGSRVFNASFEANLNGAIRNPTQGFQDLTLLRQFLTGTGAFAFFDVPWTPIYLAVLFILHPLLGWAGVGFVVLTLAVAIIGQRMTGPLHVKALQTGTEATTYLHGKMRNAETVEALGMAPNLSRQWLSLHERHLDHHERAAEAASRLAALTKFMQYTQQSLILALGALLAIRGDISAGAMIAANALSGNALRPIGTLAGAWKQYVESRQAYKNLEKLLNDDPERSAQHDSETVAGQVTLKDLVASAPGREQPILKGLNVEFSAGEVIAIIGPSGAGKSTLARCIVGIWPSTQGQVLLDGHPVSDWSREVLGPHLGYLPQDIELFDGSIAENIARFGEVDSGRVIEAARRTGIHDMVLRLPKGYDTPMGEAGGQLSGGQRQRIGLARAIYGDPSVIVLDEPNASLDDAGEAALMRTVRELRAAGKTVFMIVHQQHLLAVADRALLIEDGQIKKLMRIEVKTPTPHLEVQT